MLTAVTVPLEAANRCRSGVNATLQPSPQVPNYPLDIDAPPGIILESTQPGLNSDKVTQIPGLIRSMANGESIPATGGYRDGNRFIISEGNHRMAAALEMYKQTGNPQYVQRLLNEGRWTNLRPGEANQTFRITN